MDEETTPDTIDVKQQLEDSLQGGDPNPPEVQELWKKDGLGDEAPAEGAPGIIKLEDSFDVPDNSADTVTQGPNGSDEPEEFGEEDSEDSAEESDS